ncbi:hypothetical protein ACFL1G_07705 [Planctomycetota bacterium]
MSKNRWMITAFCVLGVSNALALQPGPNDVLVKVVDVSAGLCCIVAMPGDQYLIYDAGHYSGDRMQAFGRVQEIIPEDSTVKPLVLSHSDSDYLGAVDEICDAYTVERVLRTA